MVLFIFYGPKTARRGGRTYKQLPHMQTAAAACNTAATPKNVGFFQNMTLFCSIYCYILDVHRFFEYNEVTI